MAFSLSPQQKKTHESYPRVLTKNIRLIDLSLGQAALNNYSIWEPKAGRALTLLAGYVMIAELVGNPAVWSVNLKINNVDVVAATVPVAAAEVVGAITQLTIVPNKVFTKALPLQLTTIADLVATKAKLDLILVAVDLTDIYGN